MTDIAPSSWRFFLFVQKSKTCDWSLTASEKEMEERTFKMGIERSLWNTLKDALQMLGFRRGEQEGVMISDSFSEVELHILQDECEVIYKFAKRELLACIVLHSETVPCVNNGILELPTLLQEQHPTYCWVTDKMFVFGLALAGTAHTPFARRLKKEGSSSWNHSDS